MTPPRFERYGSQKRDEEPSDPDDETIFSGLKSLRPFELALFLAAIISSLLIWLVFIWVHRGFPGAG